MNPFLHHIYFSSGGGETYSEEYQAVLDKWTADGVPLPDSDRKTKDNTFITTLKDLNKWTKIDRIWVLASHDTDAATYNLKDLDVGQISKVNAPLFVENIGFTPNGVDSYLNTNTILSTLTNYTINNCSFGCHIVTNSEANTDARTAMGVNQSGNRATLFQQSSVPREARAYTNNNTVLDYVGAGELQDEVLYSVKRTAVSGAGAIAIGKNGVNAVTGSSASVAVPTTHAMVIGALNSNGVITEFINVTFALAVIGSGDLIDTDFYNAWNTYYTSL